MSFTVRTACHGDAAEVAAVAGAAFPLACPPSTDPADIEAVISTSLSTQRFATYLSDPQRVILVVIDDGRIVGYSMLIRGIGDDPDIAASVSHRPVVELSKMYMLASHHHSGASALLMVCGIEWAAKCGAAAIWLGVNRKNERAQGFYRKHGFEITGTRRFLLGSSYEDDFVMVRKM